MAFQERTYRNYIKTDNPIKFEVIERETNLLILSESNLYAQLGKEKIKIYLDAEMLREFFESFVYKAGVSLHLDLIRGKNTHHKIEAIFKAFGVALSRACQINPRKKGVPSTKGVL